MTYPSLYYPASRTAADAQPIRVGSGDEKTSADMTLPLVPTGAIFGRLLSPTGDPPSNWAMHLVPADSGELSADPDTGIAITNTIGEFMFLGIPEGQYVIQTVRRPQNMPPPPHCHRRHLHRLAARPGWRGSIAILRASACSMGLGLFAARPYRTVLWTAMPVAMSMTIRKSRWRREGLKLSGRVEFEGSLNGRRRSGSCRWRSRRVADGWLNAIGPRTSRREWASRSRSPAGQASCARPARRMDAKTAMVSRGRGRRRLTSGTRRRRRGDHITDQIAIVRGTVRWTDTPAPDTGELSAASQLPSPGTVICPTDSRNGRTRSESRRLRTARATGTGSFTIGTLPRAAHAVAIPEEYATEWQDPAYLEMLSRVATRVVVSDSGPQNVELRTEGVKPPGGGDRPAPAPDPSSSDVARPHGPAVDAQVSAPPAQGPVRAPQIPQPPAPSVTQPARDPGAAPTVGLGSIAGAWSSTKAICGPHAAHASHCASSNRPRTWSARC